MAPGLISATPAQRVIQNAVFCITLDQREDTGVYF